MKTAAINITIIYLTKNIGVASEVSIHLRKIPSNNTHKKNVITKTE